LYIFSIASEILQPYSLLHCCPLCFSELQTIC